MFAKNSAGVPIYYADGRYIGKIHKFILLNTKTFTSDIVRFEGYSENPNMNFPVPFYVNITGSYHY